VKDDGSVISSSLGEGSVSVMSEKANELITLFRLVGAAG
jgi:hypothetical protein